MTTHPLAVVLRVGMTHREARAAVAGAWPHVDLRLYHGTPAYYKEGPPYADEACTGDEDVLRPLGYGDRGRPVTEPVTIAGTTSSRERRDLIYRAFGLEPEFECVWPRLTGLGDSLDEMQANARRWRAAFVNRHGRPPGPDDRFDGLAPAE